MTDEQKRKISVGFLKPSDLEGDTIYVTLTPHGESVRADAVSKEEFFYYSKDKIKSNGKECNNYRGSSMREGYPIYTHYWGFINEISRENDAKVSRDRMESDGIKLSKLVQTINYETRIVKDF